MIKKYFFATLLFFVFSSVAQKQNVKELLKVAQLDMDVEDYLHAWPKYRLVLSLDPNNAKAGVNAATCLFKLNFGTDSMNLLISNLTTSSNPDSKYYLAKIDHQQKRFDEALVLLEKYNKVSTKKRSFNGEETDYLINVCKNAKQFMSIPHRSVIKNMGPEINSPAFDYVPVIVPDEATLYFTSRRAGSSNNKKDAAGNYHEDVYVSHKENGKWKAAENVGPPINTETNDACVSISPDGQTMIIYRTAADLVTGDLYLTKMGADGKWEEPVKMGKEINSQFIETSACFTNDTGTIYFSTNRPGGYGGKDIYRI
ncbi:MAG: hypothetical protein ACXVC7_11810, partial [Bacteroidia bacterium]